MAAPRGWDSMPVGRDETPGWRGGYPAAWRSGRCGWLPSRGQHHAAEWAAITPVAAKLGVRARETGDTTGRAKRKPMLAPCGGWQSEAGQVR
jgi:hypothetical protein